MWPACHPVRKLLLVGARCLISGYPGRWVLAGWDELGPANGCCEILQKKGEETKKSSMINWRRSQYIKHFVNPNRSSAQGETEEEEEAV